MRRLLPPPQNQPLAALAASAPNHREELMAHIPPFSRVSAAAAIFFLTLLSPHFPKAAALDIANNSPLEILNILVRPESGKPQFFWRLDLAPKASDQVENPGCKAALRLDTGLSFILFKNVNLAGAAKIAISGPEGATLAISGKSPASIMGEITNLVPRAGEKILCELDQFRPRMPMKDVCAILPAHAPRDDNGSVITGLSFAGIPWAARLIPTKEGPVSDQTRLEHLELRRPLAPDAPLRILAFLESKGYIPWQAEFPGIAMDFADMANQDPGMREKLLRDAVEGFMADAARAPEANPADTEMEASIMLAPAASLPSLADADTPPSDVQLYTLVIRPVSGLMLIDVAAYQGGE